MEFGQLAVGNVIGEPLIGIPFGRLVKKKVATFCNEICCNYPQTKEPLAKLPVNRFLEDFRKVGPETQAHIPFRVGCLRFMAKFAKRTEKRSAGVLQMAL